MTTLVEKILGLASAFDEAELPYAFGGALALAFHVGEPRATRDIDVNVFVPVEQADAVFAALPHLVRHDDHDLATIRERGQVRLLWDDTPVDLFLSTHRFHDAVAADIVEVPFAGRNIPVLGATELTVFKAFFDRTKDWADIEAMLDARSPDVHQALGWLVDLLGPDDQRVARLRSLVDHQPSVDPRFSPER